METLQRTANRGSVSTGAYEVDNSCKFEDANSEAMVKSLSGQSRDCFTISFWHKRTALGASRLCGAGPDGNNEVIIHFTSSNELEIYSWEGAYAMRYKTNRVFRDTSAFYHFAFLIDTRLSTSSERTQIYVNGVLETSFSVSVVPGQNALFDWTTNIQVGRGGPSADADMSGYLAEFVYLDDTKAAHTDLGEFDSDTGIWIPKDVSGLTFGTNGAYLDFKDSSNMGNDANGGTDFTLVNITAADQATDTPTNNFCTLNPLFTGFNSSVQLPTNGATQYGLSGGNQDLSYAGTMGVTKGKWYFENYINEVVATYGARIYVGFHTFQQDYDGVQVGASTNGDALAVWQMDAGNYVAWNGGSRSITGSLGTVDSSGAGKFVGIALNLDDNQISFYYDGSAVTNGTNLSLYNMGSQTDDGIFAIPVVQTKGSIQTVNFGGYTGATISSAQSDANGYGTFEYAPPSGYYALCTKNLAEYG